MAAITPFLEANEDPEIEESEEAQPLEGLGEATQHEVDPARAAIFEEFKEVAREVWSNADFVLDRTTMFPGPPPHEGVPAALLTNPYGSQRAVGDSILRRADSYALMVSDEFLAWAPDKIHRVLIHEAVHLGITHHGREFRDKVKKHGGAVTVTGLESGNTIQIQKKVGSRFQTVREFPPDAEDEAISWAKAQAHAEPGSRWRSFQGCGGGDFGDAAGLGDLGAPRVSRVTEKTLVEASFAGLTRLSWNRALVEEHLKTCTYWLEEGKKGTVIRIDKPLPKDTRPWKLLAAGQHDDSFAVFSVGNAKMSTLAWDLPAGPPAAGGTCPGAAAGQAHTPVNARAAMLDKERKHLRVLPPGADAPLAFNEARSICAYCYASEGRYDYTEIQAATIVRYWWTRECMSNEALREEWISIMTRGVLRSPFSIQECQYSNSLIRPVRVHSSGDFFSAKYAEAWMEVANRVALVDKTYRFWAPTRTWAATSGFDWPKILEKNTAKNFTVRPSAYHVGDPAPGELAPGGGKGSTSLVGPPAEGKSPSNFQRLFKDAIWQGEEDPRRDFDCKAYAVGADGSCASARCRVCWTRPDLSVNYTFH